MPDPVRIHENEHPRVLMNVGAELTAQINQREKQLRLSQNWDDFKHRLGLLRGLEEALGILQQAEDDNGKK